MSTIVTAIYENGMLRPLAPLSLPEQQIVRLQILPDTLIAEIEQIIQALVETGDLTPPPGHSEVEPVSEEEVQRIANLLGGTITSKTPSEMIIEDRGEW